jgi:hypothetical protein
VLLLALIVPVLYLLLSTNKRPQAFLKPTEWQELKLVEKEVCLSFS